MKTKKPEISFRVPSTQNLKIRDVNACVVFEYPYLDVQHRTYEYIEVNNKTDGRIWTYSPTFMCYPEIDEDMMWLCHWNIANQIMKSGDEVSVSVGVTFSGCLLIVDQGNKLVMHQLLQDMGREIMRRESPKEAGKRSRLWHQVDTVDVLREKTTAEYIKVTNRTKDLKWTYSPTFSAIPHHEKDILWASRWNIANQLITAGDEVNVSVGIVPVNLSTQNVRPGNTGNESVIAKGVTLIREFGTFVEYEEEGTEASNSASHQEVKDGQGLSAYLVRPHSYFLCHHENDSFKFMSRGMRTSWNDVFVWGLIREEYCRIM
ncbi:hypothetical protein RJ640_006252 [Escallonia rubra]|uniref:Disease resistance protein Roq1-like winged-helix domain-containing protein n=1 Tax=Escallonia rubra TaxID=112253 RepID=A0AA88UDW3_9ASTE|nr:hypothetical protein RJ640_006252 [Escallonia rubra]